MVLGTASGTAGSARAVALRTTGPARPVVIRGSAGSATGTARAVEVISGRRRAMVTRRVSARRGRRAMATTRTPWLSWISVCYTGTNTDCCCAKSTGNGCSCGKLL